MEKQTESAKTSQAATSAQVRAKLVLASASPRRKELMTNLGLDFEVLASAIEEVVDESLEPQDVVLSLARQKALAVVPLLSLPQENTYVLAADTIVVLDRHILGKPGSRAEAEEMLAKLSGRCHQVFTGVALYAGGKILEGFAVSSVYMRKMDAREIAQYVQTGEADDKAGSYALQGIGSAFVEKIEGCYTNIIGLPMPLTVRLLREAGLSFLGLP